MELLLLLLPLVQSPCNSDDFSDRDDEIRFVTLCNLLLLLLLSATQVTIDEEEGDDVDSDDGGGSGDDDSRRRIKSPRVANSCNNVTLLLLLLLFLEARVGYADADADPFTFTINMKFVKSGNVKLGSIVSLCCLLVRGRLMILH